MNQFKNERYEYTTREVPDLAGAEYAQDKDMREDGWARVWADRSKYGVFIVYSRERK